MNIVQLVGYLFGAILSATLLVLFGLNFLPAITFGLFFYYLLRPIQHRIHTKFKSIPVPQDKLYSSPAKSIIYSIQTSVISTIVLVGIPSLLFILYIISVATTEIQRLLSSYTIPYSQIANQALGIFLVVDQVQLDRPQDILTQEFIRNTFDTGLVLLSVLSSVLLQMIIMVTLVYIFLVYDSKIATWMFNTFSLTTEQKQFWYDVDKSVKTVYLGNIFNGIVTAIIAIGIYIIYNYFAPESISVILPVLLGILTGIASLIPILGVKLTYVPLTVLFSAQSYVNGELELLPVVFFFFILSVIFIDTVPDFVIRPYLTSSEISMSLLLITYFFGIVILGFSGFFFAPIIVIIAIKYMKFSFPQFITQVTNYSTSDK